MKIPPHFLENFNVKNNFDFNKILTSKICLTNLGLTCYMNSSLQIMMHTDIFIEKIFQYKKPFIDNLTNKFIDLVEDIISIEFNKENQYILESFSPVIFYILILVRANKILLNLLEYF